MSNEVLLRTVSKCGVLLCLTIAICGGITNGISLSYFARKRQEGLGNQFLVYLNIIDTLMCCAVAIETSTVVVATIPDLKYPYVIFGTIVYALYRIALETSCVITTYLCVIRTLSVILPLYRIEKKKLYGTIGFIIAYIIGREVFLAYEFFYHMYIHYSGLGRMDVDIFVTYYCINKIMDSELTVMVLIVTVCCALSMRKLLTPDDNLGQQISFFADVR